MTADHTEHAPFDELAVGWALHALEPEDEALFVAHLAGCERCAATVAETRTSCPRWPPTCRRPSRPRGCVTGSGPPSRRPSSCRSPARRVPHGDAGHGRCGSVPGPRAASPSRRSRWRRALPSGSSRPRVAAILGLGLWNVVLTSDRQELQATVAEQTQVMNGLLGPGQATIAPLEAGREAGGDRGGPRRRGAR